MTSVLIGASKPEQILENLEFLQQPPLTEEECRRIDEIYALCPTYQCR